MFKVLIDRPLRLQMEVVDTEDRMQTMQLAVNFALVVQDGAIDYSGLHWVKCSDWRNFVDGLKCAGERKLVLVDLSGELSFGVEVSGSGAIVAISVIRKGMLNRASVRIDYSAKIDQDILMPLIQAFSDFTCWR